MKTLKIVLLGLFVLVFSSMACAEPAKPTIELVTDPPTTGTNEWRVRLSDVSGKTLAKARVQVIASMPAMGTMPYMEVQADVTEKGDGLYAAELELSMGGTWDVAVKVAVDGIERVFRYSLTTGVQGLVDRSVTSSSAGNELIALTPERVQRLGVRFAQVVRKELTHSFRAVGIVQADASRRFEVSLRYSGYIKKLTGWRSVGEQVSQGDPLAVVDSPELVAAQEEYLLAAAELKTAHIDHAGAVERLRNLGMTAADVDQLKKTRKVLREIVIKSPATGTLLEVNVRDGSRVDAGQVLFVVGDLKNTFIIARVFQLDLGDVHQGQKVDIIEPAAKKHAKGHVDLIFPNVELGAGTASVRITPDATEGSLRPGEYVELGFSSSSGQILAIPSAAVLFSGNHSYVFVDRGEGKLEPTEITVGRRSGSEVEVLGGLSEGQKIVASGTFLLSSEANLRGALPKWQEQK